MDVDRHTDRRLLSIILRVEKKGVGGMMMMMMTMIEDDERRSFVGLGL